MNTMTSPKETGSASAPGALNQLEQLRRMTRVVADTGDFALMKNYAPEDATTNPSLILKAAQKPEYQSILQKAITDGRKAGSSTGDIMRQILVLFGCEILKVVPGRVSTNERASFI